MSRLFVPRFNSSRRHSSVKYFHMEIGRAQLRDISLRKKWVESGRQDSGSARSIKADIAGLIVSLSISLIASAAKKRSSHHEVLGKLIKLNFPHS